MPYACFNLGLCPCLRLFFLPQDYYEELIRHFRYQKRVGFSITWLLARLACSHVEQS